MLIFMQMSFISVIELILIELIVMLPYSHLKDLVLSFCSPSRNVYRITLCEISTQLFMRSLAN